MPNTLSEQKIKEIEVDAIDASTIESDIARQVAYEYYKKGARIQAQKAQQTYDAYEIALQKQMKQIPELTEKLDNFPAPALPEATVESLCDKYFQALHKTKNGNGGLELRKAFETFLPAIQEYVAGEKAAQAGVIHKKAKDFRDVEKGLLESIASKNSEISELKRLLLEDETGILKAAVQYATSEKDAEIKALQEEVQSMYDSCQQILDKVKTPISCLRTSFVTSVADACNEWLKDSVKESIPRNAFLKVASIAYEKLNEHSIPDARQEAIAFAQFINWHGWEYVDKSEGDLIFTNHKKWTRTGSALWNEFKEWQLKQQEGSNEK